VGLQAWQGRAFAYVSIEPLTGLEIALGHVFGEGMIGAFQHDEPEGMFGR
jgi:hypothetical protein